LAATHGEFPAAAARLEEARTLAATTDVRDPVRGQIAYAEGFLALGCGESDTATDRFERAVELTASDPYGQLGLSALTMLGWANELGGDTARAADFYQHVLSITESRGEVLHRVTVLRGLGVTTWRQGARQRAQKILADALRVNSGLKNSTVLTVFCLEALAWTLEARSDAERAAVLLGAAQGLSPAGSQVVAVYHNIWRYHEDCVQDARRILGNRGFDAAHRRGLAMSSDAAVAYALGAPANGGRAASRSAGPLTKRERQVAELVAQGLGNKQIAAKLVISQRTAQGHVEHILTKLGFTSRAQIAAWIIENARN
jgi:non-specific serine/threonine protein kinase